MIEADLQKLVRRDSLPLALLEADIWTREGELLAARKSGQRIAGWQAATLALAVVSSATFGMFEASHLRDAETALIHSDLAPSSLLLGSQE